MQAHFVPHKSGLHRSAACALFRALLRTCRTVPLHAESRINLQNVVRYTFRKRRYEQSRTKLATWFQGGYDALDLLDAASAGDESKILTICRLIERIPAHLKSDSRKENTLSSQISALEAENSEAAQKPIPTASQHTIFQRPRPLNTLSGRRHVPRLAHADIFYYLRLKKPQPLALTGALNSLRKRRQRRQDYIAKIEQYVRFAKCEDAWDADIKEQLQETQRNHTEKEGSSWMTELQSAAHDVQLKLHQESSQSRNRAQKLLKIIEEEKRLVEMEMRVKKFGEAGQRGMEGDEGGPANQYSTKHAFAAPGRPQTV